MPDFVDLSRACPLFLLVSLSAYPFASLTFVFRGTGQGGTSHAFARGRSGRFLLREDVQLPLQHENSFDVES